MCAVAVQSTGEEKIYHEGLDLDNCFSREENDRIMAICEETIDAFIAGGITLYETRYALMPWLGLSLGIRIKELSLLRLEDFDFQKDRITVWRFKKRGPNYRAGVLYSGGVRTRMGLPPHIKGRMQAMSGRLGRTTGPIFVTRSNKPANEDVLDWMWRKKLRPQLNLGDRTPHAMRHTLGTLLADKSDNQAGAAFTVNDGLGHSRKSIAVSAQYVNRNPERLKRTIVSIFGDGNKQEEPSGSQAKTGSELLDTIRVLSERISKLEKERENGGEPNA